MQFVINDQTVQISGESDRALLWVLRDELGLTGTKYGCGIGICGSCTVHLDGAPTRACITPLSAAEGKAVRTIEGLAQAGENGEVRLHPVQRAFLEQQVPQCSWCMSGQMMTAAALLSRNPTPVPDEIRQAMNGVYCRCGTYSRIRSAVARAAEQLATEEGHGS